MENYLQYLSANIKSLRKQHNLTGEQLAGKLGITFQAVSKWENEQSSPDITLLPVIAQIFNVTIDTLFSIKTNKNTVELPWNVDDALHAVVFIGHSLVSNTEDLSDFTFKYEGKALNINSNISIHCGNIAGNATSGCDLVCDYINGNATSGCDLTCDYINGNATSGCDLTCDTVKGNISASCDLNCESITDCGAISVGCDLNCNNNIVTTESINVGCDINIRGNISGSPVAGGNINHTL